MAGVHDDWRSAHRQTPGCAISWQLDRATQGLAMPSTDVIVVGARWRLVIVEQEPEQSLGGQAFWSFGGLFFVDSQERRRTGARDSLALADWMGTAAVA